MRRSHKGLERRPLAGCGFAALLLIFIDARGVAYGLENCVDPNKDYAGDHAIAECEDRNFLEKDKDLNRVYRDAYRRLSDDKTRRHALVVAEKAWIAAKIRVCEQKADDEDMFGWTRAIIVATCWSQMTRQRIKLLERSDPLAMPN